MTIGDWDVEIKKKEEIILRPNQVDSPVERFITFEFRHRPTNYVIPKTLVFRKRQDDDENEFRRILGIVTDELKQNFVDVHLEENGHADQNH